MEKLPPRSPWGTVGGKSECGLDTTGRVLQNIKESSACIDISAYAEDAVLYHELNHAIHNQNGQRRVAPPECTPLDPDAPNTSGYFEELRTTGLPPFSDEPLSERRYREEKRMLGKDQYADRSWYYPSLGCE